MAVNIKLKRSGVAGRIPTTSSLELGEIALNTNDGRAFMKQQVGSTQTVVEFATTAGSGSTVTSASYANYATNAGFATNAGNANTANFATSASYADNASSATSASYSLNSTSASYALTASHAPSAASASYALSASYAATSSYAIGFNISGNLVVGGDITAQTLHVQTITSSVIYSSGSNVFGDSTADFQTLNGTVVVSGSFGVTGSATINNLTGSLFGTASWASNAQNATTASYANNATTASYAATATSGAYAVNATTASYANNATTSSYANTATSGAYAINATTASYANDATTASYAATATSASYAASASNSISGAYAVNATTASYAPNATTSSYALSSSYAFDATSASYAVSASNSLAAQTASYVQNAQTASYVLNAVSASYASNAELLDGLNSTAFATTTSYNAFTQSYYNDSSSFDSRIVNNSSSISLLSSSFLNSSSSFDIRIIANSSSIGLLSSSFLNFSASFNTGSFTGSFRGAFTGSFSGSLFNLNGIKNYIPVFDSTNTISSSIIYQSASYIAINENNFTTDHPEALYVFQTNPTSYNAITARGNSNNYLQLNIQNTNLGISASSDVVATANNGTEEDMYIDMGINNENYTYPGGVGAANDTYVYGAGRNFHIGNTKTGHHLGFFVGGFDSDVYRKLQLNATSSHEMSGSLNISGSLIVRNGITGSLFGTSSWALNSITSSYSLNSTSASYAISSSNAITASYAATATSGAYSVNATSASYALTASYAVSSSNTQTASYVNTLRQDIQISGSINQSGSLTVNGNITSTGTITAQQLNVQVITSSVDFVTGSTRFGTLLSNTHQFTGSVSVTGSLNVNNSPVILTNQTSSMSVLSAQTASYVENAQTASYILNAVSASYADSASNSLFAQTASYWSGSIINVESASYAASASNALAAQTASYVENAQTASYVLNAVSASRANNANSSSYALTASYAANVPQTASYAISASNSLTASYWSGSVINSLSSSFALTASYAANVPQTASYAITASFALNGGGTGLSALYIQDEGTTQGTASYINFTGDGVTATVAGGTASINIPGGGGGGGGIIGQNAILNQSSAAATWSFSHNLGTQFPVFTIFDSNNNVIIPQQIYAQNTSSALIYFSSARTGTAVAALGGGIVSSSYAISASYSNNATSASYALNSDLLDGKNSTEFATTGSNTFIGTQTVTGSLFTSGSNTLIGNTILSGSIAISGSFPVGSYSSSVNIYGDTSMTGYLKFNPQSTNIDNSISASYIFVSGSTNDLYFTQNSNGYNNITRLRWLEGNLYTGLLNGGLITAATGSTTFNLSSGSGIIVSLNASIADNPYPTVKYVNWGNFTNVPLTYLTSSIQSFIGIDDTGNVFQQNTAFNDGQYNTLITIGSVLHQNKSTVNASITYPNVAYGYKQRSYDFLKAFGPLKLSGLNINTSSSLGLTVGSGTAFADGRNYQVDPNNPSYITDPGTSVSKIFRYYQSGSEFIQDTNGGLGYTVIDPTNYNPGGSGSLAAVPGTGVNREWSIQRVFWYPNSATKGIVVYYGNTTYASSTAAIANLSYENFLEVENTKQNAVYLGAIVLRNDATFTDPTTYNILPSGLFRNVGGSGGGGTVVTTRLVDLSDVAATGATSGQALVYDSTAAKWANKSFISASISGNAATATSASYATTASYIVLAQTASYVQNAQTASYILNAISASYAASASNTLFAQTASYWSGSIINAATASYVQTAQTASYVQNAQSASYILNAVSASHANSASNAIAAQTASSADNFTVRGTLTAQTIVVQTITSSVVYSSGSNIFGNDLTNTQVLTGSVTVTGSLAVNGSNVILTNQTSSMSVATASFVANAQTASYILNAVSASYANNATTADTASFVQNAQTASFVQTSQTASFVQNAQTASYILNAVSASWAATASTAASATRASQISISGLSGNQEFTFVLVATGSSGPSIGVGADTTPGIVYNPSTNLTRITNLQATGSLLGTSSFADNAASASNATSASFASNSNSSSYALTASYALFAANGGGGGVSAIYIADEGTLQGTASYFDFTGAGVTATVNAGTASINITSGGSTTVTGSNIVLNQSVSAATWSFNHNLNTQYPVFQVFNSSNEVIIPERIVAVNTASALIYFPVSLTGKAVASVGGFNGSASYAETATTSSYALTSSYSLTGTGFPFSGSAVITGSLLVSGSGITGNLSGTASFATTASYAMYALTASTAPGYTVQFTQPSAATTWSFTHNMNTRNPIVQVYDTNYKQIIPNDIVGTGANTAEIRFDYAVSGYAIMSNGGGLYVTGSTSELSQSSAATTWSFTHNLNSKYANFTVYDSNDNVIIPAGIHVIDNNSAELYFATPTPGIAVAQFSGINGAPNATTASYALTSSYASTFTLDRSLLDYSLVNSSTVGSNNVFTQATGSYTSMFINYTAASGSNARAGHVTAVWNGSTVEFNDVSTADIGITTAVTSSVAIVSGDVQFNIQTNTSGWRIKSTVTFI